MHAFTNDENLTSMPMDIIIFNLKSFAANLSTTQHFIFLPDNKQDVRYRAFFNPK